MNAISFNLARILAFFSSSIFLSLSFSFWAYSSWAFFLAANAASIAYSIFFWASNFSCSYFFSFSSSAFLIFSSSSSFFEDSSTETAFGSSATGYFGYFEADKALMRYYFIKSYSVDVITWTGAGWTTYGTLEIGGCISICLGLYRIEVCIICPRDLEPRSLSMKLSDADYYHLMNTWI